jgi:AraC-like DNA-binding protein
MQSGGRDTPDVIVATTTLLARTGRRPTVREIASEFGLAELTLRRRWRAVTGHPPLRQIITVACLQHAAELLADGVKVEAAMHLAGFHHWSNFNRQFRRVFRTTPGRYRISKEGSVDDPPINRRAAAAATRPDVRTGGRPKQGRPGGSR